MTFIKGFVTISANVNLITGFNLSYRGGVY